MLTELLYGDSKKLKETDSFANRPRKLSGFLWGTTRKLSDFFGGATSKISGFLWGVNYFFVYL